MKLPKLDLAEGCDESFSLWITIVLVETTNAVTTNPLLALFKEQLEAECATLATKHNLTDRGHFLIYWYFTRLKGFTDAEVGEIFCDGGGDLGIDSIWIDESDLVSRV